MKGGGGTWSLRGWDQDAMWRCDGVEGDELGFTKICNQPHLPSLRWRCFKSQKVLQSLEQWYVLYVHYTATVTERGIQKASDILIPLLEGPVCPLQFSLALYSVHLGQTESWTDQLIWPLCATASLCWQNLTYQSFQLTRTISKSFATLVGIAK